MSLDKVKPRVSKDILLKNLYKNLIRFFRQLIYCFQKMFKKEGVWDIGVEYI